MVNEVLNTKPVTYKIVELMGEVKGSFYEKELQKAKQALTAQCLRWK